MQRQVERLVLYNSDPLSGKILLKYKVEQSNREKYIYYDAKVNTNKKKIYANILLFCIAK